ncbi:MAG TPA: hypothetical protein VEK56_04915 [Vicinamibacterales bacterium]|nr:hypothetical protein [Vicinamibacterales bacterium]
MNDREHVISVVLNNEEWKAFLQIQPEPVTWLKARIQERIAAERPAGQQTEERKISAAETSSYVDRTFHLR